MSITSGSSTRKMITITGSLINNMYSQHERSFMIIGLFIAGAALAALPIALIIYG